MQKLQEVKVKDLFLIYSVTEALPIPMLTIAPKNKHFNLSTYSNCVLVCLFWVFVEVTFNPHQT